MKKVLPTTVVALSALVACSGSAIAPNDFKQPRAEAISGVPWIEDTLIIGS
ncbi:hypothetical protein ACWD04_33650 [Streptomyces sp. NPDC002911]